MSDLVVQGLDLLISVQFLDYEPLRACGKMVQKELHCRICEYEPELPKLHVLRLSFLHAGEDPSRSRQASAELERSLQWNLGSKHLKLFKSIFSALVQPT